MKFYSRKLHNVEDLENERKRLLKQQRQMDKEPFLSLGSIVSSSKQGDTESKGGGLPLLGLIPFGGPVLNIIGGLVRRQLNKKKDPVYKAAEYSHNIPGREKKHNMLRTMAVDVVTSYLKWKAIELSMKGAKKLMEKRREKNEELRHSGMPH